jgi:hypothetical protein
LVPLDEEHEIAALFEEACNAHQSDPVTLVKQSRAFLLQAVVLQWAKIPLACELLDKLVFLVASTIAVSTVRSMQQGLEGFLRPEPNLRF